MKGRPSYSALLSGRKSRTAPPASGSCLPSGAPAAASQSLDRAGPGRVNSTVQRTMRRYLEKMDEKRHLGYAVVGIINHFIVKTKKLFFWGKSKGLVGI
jgi:hypothetical protein